MQKNRISQIFVLALLLITIFTTAAACGTATTQGKVRYKVRTEYTTIGSAAEAAGKYFGDMTQDDIVEFLNTTWASAKYKTLQAGENSEALDVGWVEADVLRIPPNQVGVIKWDDKVVVIPPRAYSNIPNTDDEIQVVDALYVQPGQIAWRMNVNGRIEYKLAQEVHYLLPARDWMVEPSLIVQPGNMAYKMLADGSYEFKSPGQYADQVMSVWTIVPGITIESDEFGVYIHGEDPVEHLDPGIYYDKLPKHVTKYKRNRLRYRTLWSNVIEKNPKPTDPACMSLQCEYRISGVSIKNSNRDAEVNIDVLFTFVEDRNDLEPYRHIGDMLTVMQNYVATPARSQVDVLGSRFTTADLRTLQGRKDYGEAVRKEIQDNIDANNIPIIIEKVNIRGLNLNDDDLREAAHQADIAKTESDARTQAAQSQLDALNAEDDVRTKQAEIEQEEFERMLQNKQRLLEVFANSGLDWRQFWVLFASKEIELELYPNGELAAPNAYMLNSTQ